MRLLRTDDYSLKEFSENDLPSYVILSHTWGSDEVTFADLRESGALGRIKKSRKIVGCCKQARQDGYEWVWIDTCNIDKSSSAELSEAINSMYRWYEGAHICYAYLADVDITRSTSLDDQISGSRWMTRAWTLQELIGLRFAALDPSFPTRSVPGATCCQALSVGLTISAPEIVEFYDADWSEIGTKSSLSQLLHNTTGIDVKVLAGQPPSICNVADRISWASTRKSTREEDMAYSLLGLLQVHIPLLYGEGPEAFRRLQEEVIRTSQDHTILTWKDHSSDSVGDGMLAPSPRNFCRRERCKTCLSQSTWTYKDLLHRPFGVGGHAVPSQIRPLTVPELPVLASGRMRLTLPLIQRDWASSDAERATNVTLAYLGYADPESDTILCVKLIPSWENHADFCRRGIVQLPAQRLEKSYVSTVNVLSWRNQQKPRLTSSWVALRSQTYHTFQLYELPSCLRTRFAVQANELQNLVLPDRTYPVWTPVPVTVPGSHNCVIAFLHEHDGVSEAVFLTFGHPRSMPACDLVCFDTLGDGMKQYSALGSQLRADRHRVPSTRTNHCVSVALKRRPWQRSISSHSPRFGIKLGCEEFQNLGQVNRLFM